MPSTKPTTKPNALPGTIAGLGLCAVIGTLAAPAAAQADRSEYRMQIYPQNVPAVPSFNERFGVGIAQGEGVFAVGASFESPFGGGELESALFLYDQDMTTRLSGLRFLIDGIAFGHRLAIEGDVLYVAAPRYNNGPFDDVASVQLFDIADPTNPVALGRCETTDPVTRFARAFDVSGGIVAVGDTFECAFCTTPGEVFLFDATDPTNPTQQSIVTPDLPGHQSPLFGFSMAIESGLLVVGSPRLGRVHIFDVTDAASPVELASIAQPTPGDNLFGYSLTLEGSTLLVGAPNDSALALRNGAVHAYDLTDPAAPAFIRTLRPSGPFEGTPVRLGYATDIDGETVVATACPYAETFDLATGDSLGKLLPSLADGCALTLSIPIISGSDIFLGAPEEFTPVDERGAVYVFRRFGVSCNGADPAEPYGVLNNADVNAYVSAFLSQSPEADLDSNQLWNNADINLFISAFLAGCN